MPSRPRSFCAVGWSKTAIVALPIEMPGSFTMPTTLNFWTGPRFSTPIVSPSAKFSCEATRVSIAISCGPFGQRPCVSSSGLKRWSPFGLTLDARLGAPWVVAGGLKAGYDLLLWRVFRRVELPS